MKRIVLKIGLLFFTVSSVYAVEKSSSSPNFQITKLKLKVNRLEEEIEGLKSIVDSSNSQKVLNKKIEKKIENLSNRVDKIETSIDKILKIISLLTTQKEDNIKKIDKKSITTTKIAKNNYTKNLSGKELFSKAFKFYKAKKYDKARAYFLEAVEKNYKQASSYFYIAESLYYQKRYEDAIIYYKKSIYKYDKPKYLSTLLLHTGISFFKIGDKESAKNFLEATIEEAPKSKNAKIAQKFLKKL